MNRREGEDDYAPPLHLMGRVPERGGGSQRERGREERIKFSLRLVQGVSWEEEIIGTRIIHRRNLHCSRVMWLRFLQTPPLVGGYQESLHWEFSSKPTATG